MQDAKIIPELQLARLNSALYFAQLKEQECRTLIAQQQLAQVASKEATNVYKALVAEVNAALGVHLDDTQAWNAITGEVVDFNGSNT